MDKLTVRDAMSPASASSSASISTSRSAVRGSRTRLTDPGVDPHDRHACAGRCEGHPRQLGRPNGKVTDSLRLQLRSASAPTELIRRNVPVTGTTLGVGTEDAQTHAPARSSCSRTCGSTREEEGRDPEFAATLASYADIYVNVAFGTAHRAHASTVGIAKLLPAYAGLLMERE